MPAWLTAVAYVKVGSAYTLSSIKVTKNIAEIAMNALNDGTTGAILTSVATYLSEHYMVKASGLNQFNEYTITKMVTVKYGYSNLSALYADFIADYNAATGASLTTSSAVGTLATSMYAGLVEDAQMDFSSSNAAKFFTGANFVKWKWILEYFADHGSNVHVKNQANALLREDRTCQAAGLTGWRIRHLSCAIYNFFKTSNQSLVYNEDTFTNEDSYAQVTWPSVTDFNDENVIAVGSFVTLPAAPSKSYYNFTKYNDGTNNYDPGDSYEVTTNAATIKSVFTAINYSITYNTNGGTNAGSNPTVYNTETANIALAPATRDGYAFDGWYRESDFSDSAVTVIPKGSHGNEVFYAKWEVLNLAALNVTSAEVAILNNTTPDIIVKAGLEGGYYLHDDNQDLDASYAEKYYVVGTNAFTTVSAALTAATNFDAQHRVIYVFAGNYNETLSVEVNATIIGPATGKKGNANNRGTEANFTRLVEIVANNVTIKGLEFSDKAAIKLGGNNTTIQDCNIHPTTLVACNGNNRKAAIVDMAVQDRDDYIKGVRLIDSKISIECTSTDYQFNYMSFSYLDTLYMRGNYITNTATSAGSGEGMMIYYMKGRVDILENTFAWGSDGYVTRIGYYSTDCAPTVDDPTAGVYVTDNLFTENANGVPCVTLGIQKLTANTTLKIVHNRFVNFSTATFYCVSSASGSHIYSLYNYFSADKPYKFSDKGSATVTTNHNCYLGAMGSGNAYGGTSGSHPDTTTYATIDALEAAYTEYLES